MPPASDVRLELAYQETVREIHRRTPRLLSVEVLMRVYAKCIGGVAPGRYRVEFASGCGATGYATQWWQDANSVATVIPRRCWHHNDWDQRDPRAVARAAPETVISAGASRQDRLLHRMGRKADHSH